MLAKDIVVHLDNLERSLNYIHNRFLQMPHQIVNYQRGEVIYHQGDKIEKVGFVIEGVLKCANYTNAGDEINPHYFYGGDIFPEYLLLTGEKEYIYTLVADKRSKVILVDFRSFENLIMSDMNVCQSLIVYMAQRGLLAKKWKLCNCYGDLRTSIAYMLLEIYGVSDEEWTEISDNQRIIASKLQVSRTAYNQHLNKLEEEKIIERNKSKIRLLKRDKLESYL